MYVKLFQAGIDHILSFHLDAAPIRFYFAKDSISDKLFMKSSNICYQKSSCADFKMNSQFNYTQAKPLKLVAKNCAEEKVFDLGLVSPEIHFNTDVQIENYSVKVYLKKTPYPIQLTISNQKSVIIQVRVIIFKLCLKKSN